MHEYLSTVPFDLYQLHLFRLVVTHRSFTKAASAAGLTQSAITRQIQGIEKAVGLSLLERSTRSVKPTPAGEFLLVESGRLIGDVDACLRRLQDEFGKGPKEIRIGVSRSLGLAHIPGLLHPNLRRVPELKHRLTSAPAAELLPALEANELDVVVMGRPRRTSKTIRTTHAFTDAFCWVAPDEVAREFANISPRARKQRLAWFQRQSFLAFAANSGTGKQIIRCARQSFEGVEPAMELDSFDLIIKLVNLGMGIALVPQRALAPWSRRNVTRLTRLKAFEREIVVLVRRQRSLPGHLTRFIDNIPFGRLP